MNQRNDYLTWEEYFMGVAILSSQRSKDPNTQVGAVIVKDNYILSIGYNGAPKGFDDVSFPWDRSGEPLNTKYPFVCHAELNAISNFPGNKEALVGATLYVTLFPCNECAKLVIQNGIKKVVYLEDKYKDTDGVKAAKLMFKKCGVDFEQYGQQDENEKENEKVITLRIKRGDK